MLINISKWLINRLEQFRRYKTQWIEDLPEHPVRNTVYIIGGRKYPFYAAMRCPKRKCQKIIHLEVDPQSRKGWRITEHKDGSLSLMPSVHIIDSSCGCHYWLKKGHIVWSEVPPFRVPEENRNLT